MPSDVGLTDPKVSGGYAMRRQILVGLELVGSAAIDVEGNVGA